MPSSYTLDAEEEEMARRLIESGQYRSIAEVIGTGLRRLVNEEELRHFDLDAAEMRRLVEEGEASGMLEEDGEVTLERLRERYRLMLDARRSA